MAANDYQDTAATGTNAQVVVGLFRNSDDAEQAINELKTEGFRANQIGAAFVGGSSQNMGTARSASGATGSYPATGDFGTDRTGTDRITTSTGHAAAHAGSWWDRVKSAFTDEGATDTTGRTVNTTGTTNTAGTEDSTSLNYGTGEGHLGSYPNEYDYSGSEFEGSLTGLGIAPEQARRLAAELGSNGAIVTVHDSGRAAEAEEILADNNGRIRHEGSDSLTGTAVGSAAGTDVADTTANRTDMAQQRVQLFGEVLRVHKDRINRGEVRLRKEVITDTQTVEVPVSREELIIERVAGSNQPVDSKNAFSGEKEIRIPLSEEHARVDKDAVVREEVSVGKRTVTGTESVDEQVRHEELRVEDNTKTGNTTTNTGNTR